MMSITIYKWDKLIFVIQWLLKSLGKYLEDRKYKYITDYFDHKESQSKCIHLWNKTKHHRSDLFFIYFLVLQLTLLSKKEPNIDFLDYLRW